MRCEHYQQDEEESLCHSGKVPSEPSDIWALHYCLTERHRYCPLYRHPTGELSVAIRQEICRAIG